MRRLPLLVLIGFLLLPTITTAQTPQPICPGFKPSRLVVGQQGQVTPGDPNNMREEPHSDAALVMMIPRGEVFTILDGPVCDPAGRAWWHVDYKRFR